MAVHAGGARWLVSRVGEPAEALAWAVRCPVHALMLCQPPEGLSLPSFSSAFRRLARGAGIVGLARDPLDLPELESAVRQGQLDDAFLDDGSGRVFPALVRLEEERRCVLDPARRSRILLLVEDEAAFASFLLPAVTDLLEEAGETGCVGLALARSFEEAMAILDGVGERLGAVISDLGFPRADRLDPFAGLALLREVRRQWPAAPLLAQSFEAVNQSEAEAYGFSFVHKRAADYLERLLSFLCSSPIRARKRTVLPVSLAEPAVGQSGRIESVGTGSLGGRVRGLCRLAETGSPGQELAPGVRVSLAAALVLRPAVGEALLASAELGSATDWAFPERQAVTARRAVSGRLPEAARRALSSFLETVPGPVVVAGSTNLDDLPGRPVDRALPMFAIADQEQARPARLACLESAVKQVFAAAWLPSMADALEGTPFRPEQLRLAVLVQALPGAARQGLFFPLVSMRVWSHNAYPFAGMCPEDGAAELLVGVGGDSWSREALRFCPAQPRVLPQLSAVEDVLHNAQRRFAAVDLERLRLAEAPTPWPEALVEGDITTLASELGAADLLSSFLADSDRVVDGLQREGVPLLTFSGWLKSRRVPLPAALEVLLRRAGQAFDGLVELHLAVEPGQAGAACDLVLSDVRPVAGMLSVTETRIEGKVVVRSGHALGLAGRRSFADVVLVLPGLDRSRTVETAGILEQLNRELKAAGRRYLLIGPGRWGSRDPWLGIPVAWSQIAAAGAIVETDFTAFEGDPSFGSHFFHTLTSQGVPYLSVHRSLGGGEVDWRWLEAQPAERSLGSGLVRLLRCDPPIEVRLEGASRVGLVIAPAGTGKEGR